MVNRYNSFLNGFHFYLVPCYLLFSTIESPWFLPCSSSWKADLHSSLPCWTHDPMSQFVWCKYDPHNDDSSLGGAMHSCLEEEPGRDPTEPANPFHHMKEGSTGRHRLWVRNLVLHRPTQSALISYFSASRVLINRFQLFITTQIMPFCYHSPLRPRHLSILTRTQSLQWMRCKGQGNHRKYIFSTRFLIEEVWSWKRVLGFHARLDFINKTWDSYFLFEITKNWDKSKVYRLNQDLIVLWGKKLLAGQAPSLSTWQINLKIPKLKGNCKIANGLQIHI